MSHSLDEIRAVEQQLQQAMVKNDVQALERLLHDDLVFIDVQGEVQVLGLGHRGFLFA